MNTKVVVVPQDRVIGIGSTRLVGVTTDISWVPSDVHAFHWDGTSGEIEYNDGKPNEIVSSIGIYSQVETSFNNELQLIKESETLTTEQLWELLRRQRNGLLFASDYTQLNDAGLTDSKKAEWVTYRQALRDLPANTSDPENPTWPTQPS